MKQTYIKPCTLVEKVETEAILQNYSTNGKTNGSLSMEDWEISEELDF